MSNSLQSHELQHSRPPCPSPTPRDYSNSCPLSRWCHPAILSCVIPLSSCLQSFPASGSFQMSQLFTSGGQSIGASASALVLPMNIQYLFCSRWTAFISFQSKGLLRVFSNTSPKACTLCHSPFFIVQLSHSIHDYWKSHNFDYIGVCCQSLINGQYPKYSPAPPVARAWRWWVWWSWEYWWLTVQVVAAGDFESLAEANLFGTFSQQWACGIVNSLRQFQGWYWPG